MGTLSSSVDVGRRRGGFFGGSSGNECESVLLVRGMGVRANQESSKECPRLRSGAGILEDDDSSTMCSSNGLMGIIGDSEIVVVVGDADCSVLMIDAVLDEPHKQQTGFPSSALFSYRHCVQDHLMVERSTFGSSPLVFWLSLDLVRKILGNGTLRCVVRDTFFPVSMNIPEVV
jgi:hypothetical protein